MSNNNAQNVKLGVCKIFYGGRAADNAKGISATTEFDLGYTKGGVEVEVTTATHPVTIDQFGETVVKEYITKREVKIKIPLAETTLENLVKIMPGAELVTATGTNYVSVKSAISTDLRLTADKLVLRPKVLHDANPIDHSEDFIIPWAATAGAMKFAYKHDQERVFDCDFMAYPDDSTGILFTYGDTTV